MDLTGTRFAGLALKKTRAALSHHRIVDTKPTVLFPACAPSSWRLARRLQKVPIGACTLRRPGGERRETYELSADLSDHRIGAGVQHGRSGMADCLRMPPIKTVVTKVAEQECSAYVMRPPTFPISINPYIEGSFDLIGDPNGWEYNVKKTNSIRLVIEHRCQLPQIF